MAVKRLSVPNWIKIVLLCMLVLAVGFGVQSHLTNRKWSHQEQIAKGLFEPSLSHLPNLPDPIFLQHDEIINSPPSHNLIEPTHTGTVNRYIYMLAIGSGSASDLLNQLSNLFTAQGWRKAYPSLQPQTPIDSLTYGNTNSYLRINVDIFALPDAKAADESIVAVDPAVKTKLNQHFAISSQPIYGYSLLDSYSYPE